MKNINFFSAVILLVAGNFLTSCSVRENIYLNRDGSGTVSSRVEVKQILANYFSNLAEVTGNSKELSDGKLFDTEEIKAEIKKQPGVEVKSIKASGENILTTELEFRDISKVFKNEKGTAAVNVVSLKDDGGNKVFRFHLDKKNFKQLSTLIPILSNPIIESLGPQDGDSTTESEYLDMMSFALGENGPKAVKNSMVKVIVHIKGKVISQKGGKISGNVVTFSIPLIKLLLLNKPLDYSVTFK